MRTLGRVLLLLGAGLLGLVLLVAGLYVVRGVTGTVDLHQRESRARDDLAQGLPAATDEARRWHQEVRAEQEGAAPAWSWTELTCGLDSVDAGWMVQGYEQRCVLRAVAVWPRTEAPEQCVEGPQGTVLAPARLLGPSDASWPCPRDLTAAPQGGTTRLLDGERARDLAAGDAWLVAEHQVEVSRSDLGCSPWGVIFCSAPVERPDLGRVTDAP